MIFLASLRWSLNLSLIVGRGSNFGYICRYYVAPVVWLLCLWHLVTTHWFQHLLLSYNWICLILKVVARVRCFEITFGWCLKIIPHTVVRMLLAAPSDATQLHLHILPCLHAELRLRSERTSWKLRKGKISVKFPDVDLPTWRSMFLYRLEISSVKCWVAWVVFVILAY